MRNHLLFWALVFSLQLLNAQNAPTAANDTFTINKNQQTSLPVTGNDFDIDGDPITVTSVSAFSHGSASLNGNNVVYTPAFNYVGTDQAAYTLCDSTGRCTAALIFINITGMNNPPVAANDTFTINKNNQTTLPVTSNDFDPDGDPITVTTVSAFTHGTASLVGNTVVYTPNLNYVGTDEAVYFLCDTAAQCDTGVVFIYITGFNNGPIALNDTFIIPENMATFLPVTGNDFDPDGDPLDIAILMNAQHGTTVVTNGTQVIYTPTPFFFG